MSQLDSGKKLRMLEKNPDSGKALNMRRKAQKKPPMFSHQWMDMVDLEMCRAIATKIRRRPSLMRIPHANLRRWRKKWGFLSRAQWEWKDILEHNPTERVLEILTQDNDEGQRLRQSDPFSGILTVAERRKFLKLDEKKRA